VVALLMAWARVAIDGHIARANGDELAAAGKADEAVGFYDRALHMYWPVSPDVARAVAVLSRWGAERETAGDDAGALHAWRVLRSGLYASRSLYQPYPDMIATCEAHIAALEAKQLGDSSTYARQLQQLQKSVDPSRGWSLAALAGFALWVGAAAAFIWRAMTPEGKLKARPALAWAALFVAGYVLWLIALRLA
jgi:hypothetical protein